MTSRSARLSNSSEITAFVSLGKLTSGEFMWLGLQLVSVVVPQLSGKFPHGVQSEENGGGASRGRGIGRRSHGRAERIVGRPKARARPRLRRHPGRLAKRRDSEHAQPEPAPQPAPYAKSL
jgi:hypothetical protein